MKYILLIVAIIFSNNMKYIGKQNAADRYPHCCENTKRTRSCDQLHCIRCQFSSEKMSDVSESSDNSEYASDNDEDYIPG